MTEEPRTPMDPRDRDVQDAVRRLPRVEADPAFRDRLMRDFVSGALDDAPEAAPPAPPRRETSMFAGLTRWLALPAAAALVVVALHVLNRGPGWQMSWVTPPGVLTLDDRPHEPEELGRRLAPGRMIATDPGVAVEFEVPGVLAFEVTPDTEMLIPGPPGRWWNRTVRTRLERGEALFASGPAFPGHRLIVTTPEGMVELTGTVVSVFRDEGGTCICVNDGTAMVGPSAERLEEVASGQRMVFPAGKDPYITEIAPPHLEGMLEFGERHPGH